MRVMIKGGVWKNSEDEILKAAVMKYGLNNWSRVASLLIRKTAKQCKSRWYEWLDPSVKKTEWTREEEEKLLHLAKLFPTQWRTIAPIVGRTANQCLEHYERLLDQAQGKDEMDEDDPRRLRPGEIDPQPETKPARADPVDMAEDEKEMLSEARARLANTRGKKAKRKAREKMLEEARRLAVLQKKRELKAAGISVGKRWKRKREIDYANEIPFEHAVPAGFYETGPEEDPKANLGLANISLQALEGKNRAQEEARNRKDDERKLKKLKQDNMPLAIEMINKLNDPKSVFNRSELALPAPQLGDEELYEIVKMGIEGEDNSGVTGGLVAQYNTPAQTPMRTPMRQNTILSEAQDAIARTTSQTPLFGGESPALNSDGSRKAMPNMSIGQTPNMLAAEARKYGMTPGRTPMTQQIGMTPGGIGVGKTPSATPGATPARDGLSINEEMDLSSLPKAAAHAAKMRLKYQLDSLPAPQNEVEISMPDLPPDSEMVVDDLVEDAADREKRRAEELARLAELERARRSQVLQRDLPRPYLPGTIREPELGQGDLAQAEKLVHDAVCAMVTKDAVIEPIKGMKPPKEAALNAAQELLDTLDASDEELLRAKEMIELETMLQMDAQTEKASSELIAELWPELFAAFAYIPSEKMYTELKSVSKAERLESHQKEFEMLKKQNIALDKKCKKIEARVELKTKGYQARCADTRGHIQSMIAESDQLRIDVAVLRVAGDQESAAIQSRLSYCRDLVDAEKTRNALLQARHARLLVEKRELHEALQ